MKIVHVLGALVAGGAERLVSELLPRFREAGHELRLLLLSPRRDAAGDTMATDLGRARIPVSSGPTTRVGLRSVLWFAAALREQPVDVVHLHNPNTELAYLGALGSCARSHRLVRTVHNTRLSPSLLVRSAFRLNRADATVFCGEASKRHIGHLFVGPTWTIENGVRFDWNPRPSRDTAALRARLGLAPERLSFVCVGSMNGDSLDAAQKSHATLLRAWAVSRPRADGGELHLLGDGSLRAELERLSSGDPSVRFHGVRADAREWMTAADVFVMASRWEGLPIAAIEAVGSGVRCVFSDIEPLRELAAPSVTWCAPGDVESLATALHAATQLPEPTPSDVAQFRAAHGIDRTVERYLSLYEKLAGRTHSAEGALT